MTQPIYFVEIDHGKLGRAFAEISRDNNTKNGVLQNILTGEYQQIATILEVIEDEKSCRDVTEDFARDVADALYASREPVSYNLATWLQQQLGVTATNTLNMAA